MIRLMIRLMIIFVLYCGLFEEEKNHEQERMMKLGKWEHFVMICVCYFTFVFYMIKKGQINFFLKFPVPSVVTFQNGNRTFSYYTLELILQPFRPIHLDVHIDF